VRFPCVGQSGAQAGSESSGARVQKGAQGALAASS